ncbi:MAG TPA: histidine kinase [Ferruginibacter sp.]|nr:histidine kinase [Ferruginibacter sp.]HMP22041.1 histidine kinase [Ferruginibacter sp.]
MKTDFNHALLLTRLEIQEQTLQNVSVEIHDNIGQILSLVKLHLNTFPTNAEAGIKNRVDELVNLVSKAINDLRNISRCLHHEKNTVINLQEAIGCELNVLQNTGQFTTRLLTTGNAYPLHEEKQLVLLRIVQEALQHAQNRPGVSVIWVEADFGEQLFSISIFDNGKRVNVETLNTIENAEAIANMMYKANFIGASLTVLPVWGKGNCIKVELDAAAAMDNEIKKQPGVKLETERYKL